jgi:hypothetical protein
VAAYADNFNRANGALGSPWVAFDGGLVVASNQCGSPNTSLNTARYNNTVGADQYSEGDVTGISGSSVVFPCVRFTTGGDFYYVWVLSSNIVINKRVGGAYSQVGPTGPAFTSAFKCRLEAQGTALRLYVDGVLTISTTDSSIATGQPGLTGIGTTSKLDNWAGGDYTPPPPVAPSQITTLAAVAASSTSVALNWTLPFNGGSAITNHTVEYGTNGTTWTTFAHSALTTGAITVTGLTTGVLHYFRVAAVNAIGTGTVSPSATAVPATPTASVWSDDVFANINTGGDYWTVPQFGGDTWTAATPAGIKDAFGFGSITSVRQQLGIGQDQYVKIQMPDVTQDWLLKLRCSSTPGADPMSNGITVRRSGPYIIWTNTAGAQINFTEPTFPTGSGVVEFRIVSDVGTVAIKGTTLSTFNVASLGYTGKYQGFGAGNAGVVTYAEGGDIGAAATVPDQVPGLVTHVINAHEIDLGWSTPGNGGASITGYKIERAPDVAGVPGTWSVLAANTGAPSPRFYADLTVSAGQHWWYRVAAINSVGTGAPSVAADATAVDPPPPAFADNFANGLRSWTIARWRSQVSQAGPPDQATVNPGYVPPSSNDDGHYDGVLGTHTTPTGAGILPPYDIFVGSNNYLYVGGGSQNYGDTFLRCAQKLDMTGSGPWVIRLGFIPNPNGIDAGGRGLLGWSTVYATDKAQPSPSMNLENSFGPVPRYGFAVRLDDNSAYDGSAYHPSPTVLTYNEYVESADINDLPHAIFDLPTTTPVEVVMTFTRAQLNITADGETWFSQPWTLSPALTSAWLYLGAHNHASRKYSPYNDSRSAVFTHFEFDGPTITPQYSYPVADSLVPTTGKGEAIGDPVNNPAIVPGVNVGWTSPTGPLVIPGVPANVSSAKLLMSTRWTADFPSSAAYRVRYSLNGNATHDEATDYISGSGTFAYNFNVNPAELVIGDNTVSIQLVGQVGGFGPIVGNISLLVEAFSSGQIAVGSTPLPKLAIGGTLVRSLALGATEIWRAPLPPAVPSMPTLITVLAAGSGALAVRWSQPVDNRSALTNFTVQQRTSPAGAWVAVPHTPQTTRTLTITGLTNGTAYDVRVAAVNAVGTGGWSNVVTATPHT